MHKKSTINPYWLPNACSSKIIFPKIKDLFCKWEWKTSLYSKHLQNLILHNFMEKYPKISKQIIKQNTIRPCLLKIFSTKTKRNFLENKSQINQLTSYFKRTICKKFYSIHKVKYILHAIYFVINWNLYWEIPVSIFCFDLGPSM